MMSVLLGVAGWNFPWGIVVDVGILAAWAYAKRKRVPGVKHGAPNVAAGPNSSTDAFNALALTMFSDKVGAATDAATSELGIQPTKQRSPASSPKRALNNVDVAYKMKLLD